jgi:NADH:ubiquinone oxidoreductase subunit H
MTYRIINNIVLDNNVFIYLCIYLTGSSIAISLINNGIMETNNIKRYNIEKLVLIYISIIIHNILIILLSISILSNNRLIIVHYILIIISSILIRNNISILVISLDIISIINIVIILTGSNMWNYMLYQGAMSMYMWYSYTGSLTILVIILYYNKLGLGIGGYYIPGLYSNMMNKMRNIMYIGLGNIILMYNPIIIGLSSISNYIIILHNNILVIIIVYIWINSGYIFMDIWLYCISFSTIILSNIYYIISTIDIIYYNLYYYVYYLTITSMIIWIILVCTIGYVNKNKNNSTILLILGLLLLNSANMLRSVFGLILISMSIVIYMIIHGYIIISILLSISIISISIIIIVLYYNSSNIYKSDNNISILIIIIYSIYVSKNNMISIPFNESLSYIVILNSNIIISILIISMYILVICIYRINTGISYTYQLSIVSIMMIDIYILLIVALLICYIPIIIRYSNNISKWSNDIYEVGIGTNNSNSMYMSLGSSNIGSYQFNSMIYIFVLLDIIINVIIISNIIDSNKYIRSIIILSTMLSLYYILNLLMYYNNNNNKSTSKYIYSNNNNNNSTSIYSVLYILIILLIVLSISSLLTVLERKVLGSSQRRLGPNYNGWFGLIQIVMDGIKLVYKDYILYNNRNNKYIVMSCVMSFVMSYLLFVLVYLDIYSNISISYILLIILVILMINHIGIVISGIVISSSKWTILSSIRLVLLYIQYDILFVLIIIYIGSYNINSVVESNSIYMNSIKYPIIFVIYIYIVLMEAGRIPIDLIEAESELIAGYSIEYSGFLYALFASAEYSIILIHCYIMSIIFIGYHNNIIIILSLFVIFVIIRSTLPRYKYIDLYYMMYNYVLPIVLIYNILNPILVLVIVLVIVQINYNRNSNSNSISNIYNINNISNIFTQYPIIFINVIYYIILVIIYLRYSYEIIKSNNIVLVNSIRICIRSALVLTSLLIVIVQIIFNIIQIIIYYMFIILDLIYYTLLSEVHYNIIVQIERIISLISTIRYRFINTNKNEQDIIITLLIIINIYLPTYQLLAIGEAQKDYMRIDLTYCNINNNNSELYEGINVYGTLPYYNIDRIKFIRRSLIKIYKDDKVLNDIINSHQYYINKKYKKSVKYKSDLFYYVNYIIPYFTELHNKKR